MDSFAVPEPAAANCLGICLSDPDLRALMQQAARALGVPVDVVRPSALMQWRADHPGSRMLLDDAACEAGVDASTGLLPDEPAWLFVHARGADAPDAHASCSRHVPAPCDLQTALALLGSWPVQRACPSAAVAAPWGDLDLGDPAFELAQQVAELPVDVLISGETGVGKDCLARYLHAKATPQGPYVAVNCSAVPEALAEAELFGHEAGAFTGAMKARAGRIADADGGVLYLDEVDSCPLWLQAKLLRCLQDKGAPRVGSSQVRHSNFRLIASTKVPLQELVDRGQFRSDLYYRLKVVEIELRPIRQQQQRLLRIFDQMTQDCARRFGRTPPALPPELQAYLLSHPWPGNLREMRAAATRHTLGLPIGDQPAPHGAAPGLRAAVDAFERGLLEASLRRWRGNVAQASNELRLPVNSLHYRLKRLKIEAHRVVEHTAAARTGASHDSQKLD